MRSQVTIEVRSETLDADSLARLVHHLLIMADVDGIDDIEVV